MNPIVPQSACDFRTPPPVSVLLLPAPPKRLALPAPKPRLMLAAPKIAGYLSAPYAMATGEHAGSPLRQTHRIQAGGDVEPPLHDRTSYTVSIVPVKSEKRVKQVVEAEIANPLLLIDIRRDPDAWLEEFDRIYGPSQTIEEMDAEIEAKYPGWIKLKESWS